MGSAHGHGIYIYPDGSLYEGSFKKSTFCGYGALVYNSSQMRFIGEFLNGEPNGQGE